MNENDDRPTHHSHGLQGNEAAEAAAEYAPPAQDELVTADDPGIPEERFPIVAIGASAGGLAALKEFFAQVPGDCGVAFVVVVHLSPEHKSLLDQLLQPHSALPVQQVTQAVPLERNRVYIIPPNANLESIDTHLRLTELEDRRRERAPIDHFFRALAGTHDGNAIGVVLTGTGSDGTLGLRQIKARGGLTVVQDPDEAEYDGMPRSAISSVPVDLVLPVAKIPEAALRFAHTAPQLRVPPDGQDGDEESELLLRKICAHIRARTGRDFSAYKRSTLLRRISRRMQFHQIRKPSAYVELLSKRPDEVHALADDLLVTVTSFFRDPEVFELLAQRVIPRLFEGKSADDGVRVWSVACATGEEAYSLAMLLLEESARREREIPIQVFASDLHRRALEAAREGFYPGDIETDVGPERLERFFYQDNGGYRIRKEVRDLVVFAPHNVLGDPPFSHLDLISCRNLLIYLRRELQQQVTELFHYALEPDGVVVVGTSETLDAGELFRVEDKKHGIYQKRNVPVPEPRLPVFPPLGARSSSDPRRTERPSHAVEYGELHEQLIEPHVPASLLVSPDDKVVHLSARAGRYLVHPPGAPTTSVYKVVREELSIELRAALPTAREQRQVIRSRPMTVRLDGEAVPVILHVRPAIEPPHEGFVLVVFEEREGARAVPATPSEEDEAEGPMPATVRALEAENRVTQQRLQAIIRDYETSQEELKASNEELQSANEELRSTMEELETGKEELQSINEELQTVNQENRHRMAELDQLSRDLQHLLSSTQIATLFLDRELRILRFTPKIAELFSVRASDRGRPLSDFSHKLGYGQLREDALVVLAELTPIEREVQHEAGQWYLTRLLPYRSAEDRIGGVVITFVDITERKRVEDEVREAKEYAEHIIATLPEPLLVLGAELQVRSANAAFYEHFRVTPAETRGRSIYELGNGQWNIPPLRELLEEVLPRDESFSGFEVDREFERLGRRVMLLNGRRLDNMQLILLGISDITERHDAEQALRASEQRLRNMFDVEGVGVMIFDESGTLMEANEAFLSMLGYRREDVEARTLTWRSMTPPEHVAASEAQVQRLEQSGRIGPYEKEYIRKDGSRSWMVFAGASLGDGTIVKYCIDVSDRKRAEQALRESEQRYRTLAELSPDSILVGQGGGLVYANQAAARLLGAESVQELVGRSPLEHVDEPHHDAVRARFQQVREQQRPTERIEYRWRRLDGSLVDVEVIAGPVEWQGAPAVQVVARDITARKRAEEALRASQEQRYRTLFESIDEGFCIIEVLFDDADQPTDHRYLEVNPAFEKQTGIAGAVGRRMRELVPALEAQWFEIYGGVARTGEPVRFQRRADALGRFYDVYAFRIGAPEQRRVAVLLNDITERKELEQRLRRVATELSEANVRKDEYLAMLGHELRNPLAAIRSAIELMKLVQSDDPRLDRACGVLDRQSSHMSRLIDGLLEVSRIVRGKVRLELEILDVRQIVEALLQDRAAEIANRGLTLERRLASEPLWINGDKIRIAQVLDNLIGNAIKFTHPPGTIMVAVEHEQGCASIRVQDTGVGIRSEMLSRIFESFHQEPQDAARSTGGLGLGLALAQGLVELHGGTIRAHSEGVGTGTELRVRLPLVAAPGAAAPKPRAPEASPRRILLVEDNADAALMLRELLELASHRVTIVDDGRAALETLRGQKMDVVLCDLGLPGMSGYEVARAIRGDASLRGLFLVALTGYGQPGDRERTAEAGFDEHLTKPVDLAALTEVLARVSRRER